MPKNSLGDGGVGRKVIGTVSEWRLVAGSVQFSCSLYGWEQVTPGADNKGRIYLVR